MELSRRRAMLNVAGCAFTAAVGLPATAHEVGSGPFRPPLIPLLYTRRLVRELRGGQQLAVKRSFAVRFAPVQRDGFEMAGEQVSVDVVAPKGMAPFAELERKRVESGLFPLRLDHHGWIEHGPGLTSSSLLDRAVAEARRQIAALSAARQAEASAFVRLVHQAGPGLAAHLPTDLFSPVGPGLAERRSIELPDGATGEIEIVFSAEADPQTGLMVRANRQITTLIGGDPRTTEEHWTLVPA